MFELKSPLFNTAQVKYEVPTGGVDAGELITLNSGAVGFALTDGSILGSDELDLEGSRFVTLITEAESVEATKVVGAINQGVAVYADNTGKVTAASTGNRFIGYALESALSAATTILIRFNGGAENA
jgi:hypothetical protein